VAWSAPMTAVANSVFTAAQFNQFVRDNLNETAPAKSTQVSSHFVGNGLNSIVERVTQVADVGTGETTTSTSYTDLATVGPTVTLNTGTRAIVLFGCAMDNNTANESGFMGFEVSGASSLPASDTSATNYDGLAANSRVRMGRPYTISSLTAGSNTFTAKYKVTGGTGTFLTRQLAVFPL
jgi:hypothetical protein